MASRRKSSAPTSTRPAPQAGPGPQSPTRSAEPSLVADEQEQNAQWLEDEEPKETRGEKKKRALQLERLGESLVHLPPPKLARVPMPDDLAAAVTEARRIKAMGAHGGYRRQIQFIGRIMRFLDARPIADALEAMKGEDAPSSAAFRTAERWRDRLVAEGDAALEELVKARPDVDRTSLRQLIRQAQKESAGNKPPHASRAIFRQLRELFLPATADGEIDEGGDGDD